MRVVNSGNVLIANNVAVNFRMIQITNGNAVSDITTVDQIPSKSEICVLKWFESK